ncbi:unnamed protein product, partial [Protopolystoma xenopodis]
MYAPPRLYSLDSVPSLSITSNRTRRQEVWVQRRAQAPSSSMNPAFAIGYLELRGLTIFPRHMDAMPVLPQGRPADTSQLGCALEETLYPANHRVLEKSTKTL